MTDRGDPVRSERAFLSFRPWCSETDLHGEQEFVAGEGALEALDRLLFRDMRRVAAGKRVVDGDDGIGVLNEKPRGGCSGAGPGSLAFRGD